MANLQILTVGDAARAEFRQARQTLDAMGRVIACPDVESAAGILADTPADVVVVAQSYPGQFSQQSVDRLRRLVPLARLVALLGTWCEGEMRSGRPWPGAIRLYWHQWPARSYAALQRLAEGRRSTWELPATATDEERLLAAAETPLPKRQGLVAVFARRAEMGAWLAAAARSCGYSTVWLHPLRTARVQGATAVIYDGSDGCDAELEELGGLAAAMAPAPILALLDFPRIEDIDRAVAAGAGAVLSKPFQVDDLAWQLAQLTRPADTPPLPSE